MYDNCSKHINQQTKNKLSEISTHVTYSNYNPEGELDIIFKRKEHLHKSNLYSSIDNKYKNTNTTYRFLAHYQPASC